MTAITLPASTRTQQTGRISAKDATALKHTEPAGVLFAYATHSTSLGPRNYLISGDVHGLAEQFLEK